MKSKLKVFGVVAFAIALCFALVGCGGGDKADPKKAVIGTWELSELTGASEDDMAIRATCGFFSSHFVPTLYQILKPIPTFALLEA